MMISSVNGALCFFLYEAAMPVFLVRENKHGLDPRGRSSDLRQVSYGLTVLCCCSPRTSYSSTSMSSPSLVSSTVAETNRALLRKGFRPLTQSQNDSSISTFVVIFLNFLSLSRGTISLSTSVIPDLNERSEGEGELDRPGGEEFSEGARFDVDKKRCFRSSRLVAGRGIRHQYSDGKHQALVEERGNALTTCFRSLPHVDSRL